MLTYRKRGSPTGYSKHPLHRHWLGMKSRCRNKPLYVKEGIKVCERWLSFPNFVEDMQEGWWDGATLDRIDNRDGYFKENCRWATYSQQNANRRQKAP